MLKKLLAKRKVTNVTKAQIKVTTHTIYIVIMSIIGLVAYTDLITNSYIEDATDFILCESTGQASDCQQTLDSFVTIMKLLTAFFTMLSFNSVVLILLVCNPQAFKKKFKHWRSLLKGSSV